jgi:hypothetical protein
VKDRCGQGLTAEILRYAQDETLGRWLKWQEVTGVRKEKANPEARRAQSRRRGRKKDGFTTEDAESAEVGRGTGSG